MQGTCRRLWFNPFVTKILWMRAWQLTPVFLPGESHGQRSLAGHKEAQIIRHHCQVTKSHRVGHHWRDWTHTHTHTQCVLECIFKVNFKYILQIGGNIFPLMLYSRFSLVIYLIHSSVYMPIPISQFIPPSLPIKVFICLFSTSVSLFCFAYGFICTVFLDSTYMCQYTLFFSFWLHSVSSCFDTFRMAF